MTGGLQRLVLKAAFLEHRVSDPAALQRRDEMAASPILVSSCHNARLGHPLRITAVSAPLTFLMKAGDNLLQCSVACSSSRLADSRAPDFNLTGSSIGTFSYTIMLRSNGGGMWTMDRAMLPTDRPTELATSSFGTLLELYSGTEAVVHCWFLLEVETADQASH
ncbi:hypothetical protein N7539_005547 [Penicillium diatomitis]|uniref:Uncharacterized protein n=1 Tax=Penicillium diatomitis TaxID=2819901 RepID=A0A9W9X723_9EURO|nr:uncharacterized protein N7539_005547 [Penicillium diatomitis]KAJ5485559.1 hypothetical protein N7539_005547 [Penicillium diatomitis]